MKAKPVDKDHKPCKPKDAVHVWLHLPGPFPNRCLPVGKGGWKWNRDTELPTFTPSIRTRMEQSGKPDVVCHSFIKDGTVRFIKDCTHEYAGQTLDLLEVEL